MALSVFCSVMEDEAEIDFYQHYLVMWADYVGWIKDRAHEAITMLESAISNVQTNTVNRVEDNVPQPTSQPGTSQGGSNDIEGTIQTNQQPTEEISNGVVANSTPAPTGAVERTEINNGRTQILVPALTDATGVTGVVRDAAGSNQIAQDAMLSLAIATFDQLGITIGKDLQAIEEELSEGVISQTDSYLDELKEICIEIEKKMNVDLKEAAQKLASLDQAGTIGAAQQTSQMLAQFSDWLRSIRTEIRRAKEAVTPSSSESVNGSATTTPAVTVSQGYKPFIERLKPPTFLGKVEEWPEFRSVWKDLLAELPESVQDQHIKSHLPATDIKRIVEIRSMSEVLETQS